MPKIQRQKRNGASHDNIRGGAGSKSSTAALFKMNTNIGQHVLKNPGIAEAIVAKADLKQSDIVLEVGPGSGNLTVKILDRAKKCIAVELDPRMAAEVTKRVQGKPEEKRLEVLLGDVCKMEWPYFDVCGNVHVYINDEGLLLKDLAWLLSESSAYRNVLGISNTPYQISSPLTFRLLNHLPSPRTCILTFQAEFAQRLTAQSGSALYSRLSVNAQMWSHVTHIMKIGRMNFKPPPAVESSVVRIVPKKPRPDVSWEEWDGLLRIVFVRKNRVLRAGFLGTTTVMDLLEANYRTWCAQNDVSVEDGPAEVVEGDVSMDVDGEAPPAGDGQIEGDEEEEWQGIMDVDDDDVPEFFKDEANEKAKQLNRQNSRTNSKRRKKGKVAELVREKVRRVLEDETGLADRRARMCDEGDFLRLLWAFNQQGIHFS